MTFLNLNPRFVYGDVDLTSAPFAVNQEGIDYQNGDLVTSVLSSFLQDGELEVSQGRGNMTLVVPVLIEGSDLLDLAESHATLARAADLPTSTLSIDPGDGIAPVTVFETFRGEVAYTYNAAAEQNGFRQYNLTVRALPFGRSDFEVTAAAVPTPPTGTTPTTTLINDCSSTANWLTLTGSTVTSSGGLVYFSDVLGDLTQTYSVAGSRWVTADTRTRSVVVRFNFIEPIAYPFRTDALPGGVYRHYWQVMDTVPDLITHTRFIVAGFSTGQNDPLVFDSVSTTTGPPALGTSRQQARVIDVAGSARTQGGIQIASASASALGEVLVYTATSGSTPSLSQFRTGAPITTDATRVSGAYATLTSAAVYDVPISSLTPGLYSLMALVSAPSGDARTLSWSLEARMGSVPVGRTMSGSTVFSGSPYRFVPLGNVNLPTNGARSNTVATQRISVNDGGSGSAARLDELYLLNLSTGRVTIVSCGDGSPASGGPSSRLWLDAATAATRTPTVMRGTASDGSDAFYANDSIQLLGQHEFVPTSANIFTVTTNATDAEVALSHFPRWLTHAALVAA